MYRISLVIYYKQLLKSLETTALQNIFYFIFLTAGKAMPADFEQAIKEWNEEMIRYNQVLVQGFYNRVYSAVYTIECDYRCHYKCYFRSNCYGLSRMHRRRSWLDIRHENSISFELRYKT